MKKSYLIIFVLVIVAIIIASTYILSRDKNAEVNQTETTLRLGWQVPWATQGQLVQALKHTGILKDQNLNVDFKGFSYGGPLNEAALAGEVDVILTADQPAATLLSKNQNWVIIGRLMYNRVSLYVPPKSPIKMVADLKGKTVAMPFGAAVQRMVLKAEKNAGLDIKKDVNNINLGIYEQNSLVTDKDVTKWDKIDALAGFDPVPAIFEEKGLIRILETGKVVSLILMSKDFINKNPDAPTKLLNSFVDAYDFYRNNVAEVDSWFNEEAKLSITPKALSISSEIEPNLRVTSKNDIRLGFIDEDYIIMQEAADFLFDQQMIKDKVDMKSFIDLSYLNKIK